MISVPVDLFGQESIIPGDIPLATHAFGEQQNPVVLFIHGVLQSKETFFEQCQKLAERGYFCIAFDLPGHGCSWKPVFETDRALKLDLDMFSSALARVLEYYGLTHRPFALIGWSMGGLVIGDFLYRYPYIKPVGLVLMASTLSPASLVAIAHDPENPAIPLSSSDGRIRRDGLIAFVKHLNTQNIPLDVALEQAIISAQALAQMPELFQKLAFEDHCAEVLARLSCPVLLLHGQKDKIAPLTLSYDMKERARANNVLLEIHRDCGHSLHLEDPLWTHYSLARFLDNIFFQSQGDITKKKKGSRA
jgi:pimeloyl-ACP methyl ester carboxylesterase